MQPSLFFKKSVTFLMQGLGVGLCPLAPGTWGTLLAIPLYLALSRLSLNAYILVVFVLFAVGVYGCRIASHHLGKPDHRSLVWDEIVGFLVAMTGFSHVALWFVLVGFVLFRLFDIFKPWPIRWIDQNIHGGLGVMLDDFLAGVYTLIVMHGITICIAIFSYAAF